MQHSNKPFDELALARRMVEQMAAAKNLEEFEEAWKSYLHHLDRTWNKAKAHFQRSPEWAHWSAKYVQDRKNDELLLYLFQARNSDEHGISEITEKKTGGIGIKPLYPMGTMHIKKMVISGGSITQLDPGLPLKLSFDPPRVILLPVVNRSVAYPVPKQHLEKALTSQEPLEIAKLGIEFYADMLKQAQHYFVGSSGAS